MGAASTSSSVTQRYTSVYGAPSGSTTEAIKGDYSEFKPEAKKTQQEWDATELRQKSPFKSRKINGVKQFQPTKKD